MLSLRTTNGKPSALDNKSAGILGPAAQATIGGIAGTVIHRSIAALSLSMTALIVAGYHFRLPREVGIPSAIRPSPIARQVNPLVRSRIMRRVISSGRRGTARSRSPRARLAAKASRARWLIRRRSYWEPEMMMLAAISPAGVLVSISRSAKCSAQHSRPAPPPPVRFDRSIVVVYQPSAASCEGRAARLDPADTPNPMFSHIHVINDIEMTPLMRKRHGI